MRNDGTTRAVIDELKRALEKVDALGADTAGNHLQMAIDLLELDFADALKDGQKPSRDLK